MLCDGIYGFSSLSEKSRKSNRSQMLFQRQHFLLSYLKTLSVGPAGVRTRDIPLRRPALSQLSQPGGGWSVYSGKLNENRQVVSSHDGEFVVNLLLTCLLPARHLSSRYFFNCPFPSAFLNLHWGFHGNEAAIILVIPRHISGEKKVASFQNDLIFLAPVTKHHWSLTNFHALWACIVSSPK